MANWINVGRLLPRTLVALLACVLTACPLAGSPVRGVVVEEGSDRPLADATVYVQWMSYGSAAGLHSRTVCADIDFASTDARGQFELPSVKGRGLISAYKPGYVLFERIDQNGNLLDDRPLTEPQKILMKRFTGTVKERLEVLSRQHGKECGAYEHYVKKLLPFYRALYEEGKAIADNNKSALTDEDRARVRKLQYDIDMLEFGLREADKRYEIRRLRGEY